MLKCLLKVQSCNLFNIVYIKIKVRIINCIGDPILFNCKEDIFPPVKP